MFSSCMEVALTKTIQDKKNKLSTNNKPTGYMPNF